MQLQHVHKINKESGTEDISTQFLIYRNSTYLQKIEFAQPEVTIGKSPEADLVLDHSSVEDIHANLFFQSGQILLTNNKPNNGLCVNGHSVIKTVLQLWDVIDIGPFSIVIQKSTKNPLDPSDNPKPETSESTVKPEGSNIGTRPRSNPADSDSKRYAVVLENQYVNDSAREQMAEQLGSLFNTDPSRIRPLLKQPRHLLKKDLHLKPAIRLIKALRNAGAACSMRVIKDIQDHSNVKGAVAPAQQSVTKTKHNLPAEGKRASDSANRHVDSKLDASLKTNPDDDDDDDDRPASFTLKEKLAVSGPPPTVAHKPKPPGCLNWKLFAPWATGWLMFSTLSSAVGIESVMTTACFGLQD